MTTTRYTTTILSLALLLTLGGCVKDELHDTPHPDTGKVTVTADWADRGDGVDIPAEWTVTMGDYTGTETGTTHTPDYLFNPGSYTLAAYNTPENITVSGTTATVAPETGNGTYISNVPGWLFTSVQDVTIEADTDYGLTAAMHQQVRQLTLVIEPTGDAADRIERQDREHRRRIVRSGRHDGLRYRNLRSGIRCSPAFHQDNRR